MNNIATILSEKDLQIMNEMIDEAIKDEVYTQSQVSWNVLQQNANKFLQAYKTLEKLEQLQTEKQMNNLLSFDGFTSQGINRSQFLIKKNKIQFLKIKYLLAFNFDAKLTAFRGQLPKKAIFVLWDSYSKKNKSYKMSMNKLVELANEEGRLFVNLKDLKSEEIFQIEKENTEGLNESHIAEAQSAYRGVASRLTQFYNKTGVEWWHRKNGLLMWKLNKQWTIAKVSSYGDVKEAYIAALMTKHQQNIDKLYKLRIGDPIYYDDLLIATFFNHYISKVTNMAAVVEEDVNLIGNSAQYAVKSKGASLPSLNQYLVVANVIKNKSNLFDNTSEGLSKYIKEELFPMDAKRNIILGTFSDLEDAIQENIASELQVEVLSNIKI